MVESYSPGGANVKPIAVFAQLMAESRYLYM